MFGLVKVRLSCCVRRVERCAALRSFSRQDPSRQGFLREGCYSAPMHTFRPDCRTWITVKAAFLPSAFLYLPKHGLLYSLTQACTARLISRSACRKVDAEGRCGPNHLAGACPVLAVRVWPSIQVDGEFTTVHALVKTLFTIFGCTVCGFHRSWMFEKPCTACRWQRIARVSSTSK